MRIYDAEPHSSEGRVDAVSERQDTHQAKMTVSAVFKKTADHEYEPSILARYRLRVLRYT